MVLHGSSVSLYKSLRAERRCKNAVTTRRERSDRGPAHRSYRRGAARALESFLLKPHIFTPAPLSSVCLPPSQKDGGRHTEDRGAPPSIFRSLELSFSIWEQTLRGIECRFLNSPQTTSLDVLQTSFLCLFSLVNMGLWVLLFQADLRLRRSN